MTLIDKTMKLPGTPDQVVPSRRPRVQEGDDPPPPQVDEEAGPSVAIQELPVVHAPVPPEIIPPVRVQLRQPENLGAISLGEAASGDQHQSEPGQVVPEGEVGAESESDEWATPPEGELESSESTEDDVVPDVDRNPTPPPVVVSDEQRRTELAAFIAEYGSSTSSSSDEEDIFRYRQRE